MKGLMNEMNNVYVCDYVLYL